jgi:hypothetical protein
MNRTLIATILIAWCVPLAPAIALDPSCDPIITAGERKLEQPAWHSISESKGAKVEALKVDGQFFARSDEQRWRKGPDFDQAGRKLLAMMRSGNAKLTDCKAQGSESVDGRPTQVIGYTIDIAGLPNPSNVTLHIGEADGLPYRESTRNVQATIRYEYQGLTVPKL